MPKPPRFNPDDVLVPIPPMVMFERVKSAIKFEVPRGLHGVEVNERIEREMGACLYELSAYVLGRRRTPIFHTMTMVIKQREFTSWWQHTKAVHFPTISRWIRRPPRTQFIEHSQTETQEVKVYETYPDADLSLLGPLPEGFGPVVFQAWDTGIAHVDSESITGYVLDQ